MLLEHSKCYRSIQNATGAFKMLLEHFHLNSSKYHPVLKTPCILCEIIKIKKSETLFSPYILRRKCSGGSLQNAP